MNDAHAIIATISLAAAFGLGIWTGADNDSEFFPTGVAFMFGVLLFIVFAASFVRLLSQSI